MLIFGKAKFSISGDWNSIFKSYKKYVKKDDVVLEIGASKRRNTKILSKYCKKIIGVEYYKERMPVNFSNVEYLNLNWEKLSKKIKKNSIDLAISTHVIEHVKNDSVAINELYKVLKPGGIALINTPNRRRLVRSIIELFVGNKKFPDIKSEHQREYVETDLINLLKMSLFKKYKIIPVVLGMHGGKFYLYYNNVPEKLRRFANFWEIHLFKE